MSNPTQPGNHPSRFDPTQGRQLSAPSYVFPGRRGGVHAPGPLGQIEIPNDYAREWWPQIPAALEFRFFRLEASGAGQDNRMQVDRPTLCKIIPALSFLNTAAERWEINFSPEVPSPLGATFPGYTAARDVFLLPSLGDWIVRARARDAAGANVTDSAQLLLMDATSPDSLRALYPHIACQDVENQADVTLAAATDVLVLTLAQVAAATSLLLVNTGANPLRVSFGAVAGATTGILLTASGTFGDRLMLPSEMIPLESLHARSTVGSTITAVTFA